MFSYIFFYNIINFYLNVKRKIAFVYVYALAWYLIEHSAPLPPQNLDNEGHEVQKDNEEQL